MNISFYETLGACLKARREEVHLTQAEVAESIGLSRTSVTNIERGRQRLFLDQFEEICRALGVPPADIINAASNQNKRRRTGRLSGVKPASVERFLATVDLNEGASE